MKTTRKPCRKSPRSPVGARIAPTLAHVGLGDGAGGAAIAFFEWPNGFLGISVRTKELLVGFLQVPQK